MTKKIKIITTLCIVFVLGFAVYYHFFVSMNNLPQGELLDSSTCEDCGAVVNVYRYSGGATVSFCTRGEAVYPNGKSKNIYWSSGDEPAYYDEVNLKWLDCDTVSINGKTLNIYKDKYDFRKE